MYIRDQRTAAQNEVFYCTADASGTFGSNMSPTLESILTFSHHKYMMAQHTSMVRTLQDGEDLLGTGSCQPRRDPQQQQFARLLHSVSDPTMSGFHIPAPYRMGTPDLSRILRGISDAKSQPFIDSTGNVDGMALTQGPSTTKPPSPATAALTANDVCIEIPRSNERLMDRCEVDHFSKRVVCPLSIDEDPNWLSDFHCFVRSEMVEVFRASREDVKARHNSIAYQQVGLRCRFCAHLTPSARAGRSTAFPSSVRQIYQSFTMMTRDHFGKCNAIPADARERFIALKGKSNPVQGATKRFWLYSARKLGMTDFSAGIMISESTRAAAASAQSFGMSPVQSLSDAHSKLVPLVFPSDKALISEFLYLLMSQVQMVRVTESERQKNLPPSRCNLPLGLPGFGCRHCCEHRRSGLCRIYPLRRSVIPCKVEDLYDHIRRCTVCPDPIKEQLERTRHQMGSGFQLDTEGDRDFFDRLWSRMGHKENPKTKRTVVKTTKCKRSKTKKTPMDKDIAMNCRFLFG